MHTGADNLRMGIGAGLAVLAPEVRARLGGGLMYDDPGIDGQHGHEDASDGHDAGHVVYVYRIHTHLTSTTATMSVYPAESEAQ